jgi:hypothetical protein
VIGESRGRELQHSLQNFTHVSRMSKTTCTVLTTDTHYRILLASPNVYDDIQHVQYLPHNVTCKYRTSMTTCAAHTVLTTKFYS